VEVKAEAGVGRSTDVVSKSSEPSQVVVPDFSCQKIVNYLDFISFSKYERLPVMY
jgi:hypothetical protein